MVLRLDITKKILNQCDFVDIMKSINPNIVVVGKFVNMATNIKVECLIDGNVWDAKPRKLINGVGCRVCSCRNNGMTHSLSDIDYKLIIKSKNPNIEIIGEYINAKTKVKAKCLLDGHVWETYPFVLRSSGCPKCAGRDKSESQLRTHDEFIIDIEKVNPNVEVLGEYFGIAHKVEVRCKKHAIKWFAYPSNLRRGSGCYICKQEKILAADKLAENRLSLSEALKRLNERNPNVMLVGDYTGVSKKANFKCLICANEWSATFSSVAGGRGCPSCTASKGEALIQSALDSLGSEYYYQHSFIGCKNKQLLRFDFYVPSINTAIEYQGEQHFMPIDFAGKGEDWANEQLDITQLRDQIKRDYCAANGIRLVEILYSEIDYIPNIISHIFSSTNGVSA